MKKEPFPLLFPDSVLDSVGHKMYSFISQYDQVRNWQKMKKTHNLSQNEELIHTIMQYYFCMQCYLV